MGPYTTDETVPYDGTEVQPGEAVDPVLGNMPAESGFNWGEVLSGAADSIIDQLFGNSNQTTNNNTNNNTPSGGSKSIPGWVWITLVLVLLAVAAWLIIRNRE